MILQLSTMKVVSALSEWHKILFIENTTKYVQMSKCVSYKPIIIDQSKSEIAIISFRYIHTTYDIIVISIILTH